LVALQNQDLYARGKEGEAFFTKKKKNWFLDTDGQLSPRTFFIFFKSFFSYGLQERQKKEALAWAPEEAAK
jgi:hypothetical protein